MQRASGREPGWVHAIVVAVDLGTSAMQGDTGL